VQAKRKDSGALSREEMKQGFQGWHEHGYLPHRDRAGLVQFVTFRLADAFPQNLRSEWEALLKIEEDRKRRIELEAYLDKGRGECHLRRSEIAKLVEDSICFRHGQDYELRAWVIMPNHVHLLFKVFDVPMSQLVDAWKGFTAKQANKVLGRRGKFWQDDYWDTYMRDEEHERRTRKYIEANPVKAGLVIEGKKWPWTSARFRDDYERLCLPG
jgi:REP element-mobilizing transposase RayT